MRTRIAALLRGAAILGLLLVLAAGAGWPGARAQDDPITDAAASTEAPTPEGTLTIFTALCTVEAEPPTLAAILTGDELAEQASCVESGPALVSLDGGEAFEVESGTQVTLPVGVVTLADLVTGAEREVEIAEGVDTTLVVTTFEVLPPTEEPAEDPVAEEPVAEAPVEEEAVAEESTDAPAEEPVEAAVATGSVTLVTHLCRQGIETTDDLDGTGTWGQQLATCPVVVLGQDIGTVSAEAITANDLDSPLAYDYTVTDGTGVRAQSLVDASLAQAALCESALGENLNGVDIDDRCYDQSGYLFEGVLAGAVSVAASNPPGASAFLTGRADPNSGDDVSLGSVDEGAGTVALDTSADDAVTVHLFFAPEPIQDRVTIVGHVCPPAIESREILDAQGDIYAKLAACPSITLPEDEPPTEGETAGNRTFGVTVQGADGVEQALVDLPFQPNTLCEHDLPQSVDDDPSNDRCLDASGYVADGVAQGEVAVAVTKRASKSTFLTVEVGPDPDDEDAFVVGDATEGSTTVDTTEDGDVALHVFFARRVDPTATATPEPTETPTEVSTDTATTVAEDPATSTQVLATRTPRETSTGTPLPDGSVAGAAAGSPAPGSPTAGTATPVLTPIISPTAVVTPAEISITLGCRSAAETIRIKNNGKGPIRIVALATLIERIAEEPFAVSRTLGAGRTVEYQAGNAAQGGDVLTPRYIFTNSAYEQDGIKVVTSVGNVYKRCDPRTAPPMTPPTKTATAMPRPDGTPISTATPTPRPTTSTPRPATTPRPSTGDPAPTRAATRAPASAPVPTTTAVVETAGQTPGGSNPDDLEMVADLEPPDLGESVPPPVSSGATSGGEAFPDLAEGDYSPNPVEPVRTDPFGNIEDDPPPGGGDTGDAGGAEGGTTGGAVDDPFGGGGEPLSPEEAAAEAKAAAEVAKVDEGEDFPTVGTRRATTGGIPPWLVAGALAVLAAGLGARGGRRPRAS